MRKDSQRIPIPWPCKWLNTLYHAGISRRTRRSSSPLLFDSGHACCDPNPYIGRRSSKPSSSSQTDCLMNPHQRSWTNLSNGSNNSSTDNRQLNNDRRRECRTRISRSSENPQHTNNKKTWTRSKGTSWSLMNPNKTSMYIFVNKKSQGMTLKIRQKDLRLLRWPSAKTSAFKKC